MVCIIGKHGFVLVRVQRSRAGGRGPQVYTRKRRGRGWTKISLACALALWTGTHSAVFSSCSPVVVEQYYDWYVVVVVVRPCRLHVLWSTSTPHLNLDVVVNSESPLDLFDRSSLSPLSTSARPNQCNRSICRCMVLPGRHISSPRKFTPGERQIPRAIYHI